MERIEKKINAFLGAALMSMVGMIALGLLFALAPAFTLSILHWGITIILLLSGIAMIVRDMQSGRIFSVFSTSLMGIFLVLMGIIVAIYPETLMIVTIAFGVYMILTSFMKISVAARIKGTTAYTMSLISNLIGLICGVIMIIRPGASSEAMIVIAGILLIIYGISGLVDTFILKSKIDAVKKNVKEAKNSAKAAIEDIKEAEIVEEKPLTKHKK